MMAAAARNRPAAHSSSGASVLPATGVREALPARCVSVCGATAAGEAVDLYGFYLSLPSNRLSGCITRGRARGRGVKVCM